MKDVINTVGLIGAGRMGTPIIGHLVRKGFKVLVHDADVGKRALAEDRGATWAADCRAVINFCTSRAGTSSSLVLAWTSRGVRSLSAFRAGERRWYSSGASAKVLPR